MRLGSSKSPSPFCQRRNRQTHPHEIGSFLSCCLKLTQISCGTSNTAEIKTGKKKKVIRCQKKTATTLPCDVCLPLDAHP